MRKDNSIYNKKQPGLYIYLYLQSQIPTSCYSGKKTIRHFHGKLMKTVPAVAMLRKNGEPTTAVWTGTGSTSGARPRRP